MTESDPWIEIPISWNIYATDEVANVIGNDCIQINSIELHCRRWIAVKLIQLAV